MNHVCPKCGTILQPLQKQCSVCHTVIIDAKAKQSVTATYDALKSSLTLVSLKSRNITVILHMFFGFFGLGFFYLQFYLIGLFQFLITLTSLTISFLWLNDIFYYVVGSFLFIQFLIGLYYRLSMDAKDARKELLK
jgi:TM2 domain-containing membrane protein YozV